MRFSGAVGQLLPLLHYQLSPPATAWQGRLFIPQRKRRLLVCLFVWVPAHAETPPRGSWPGTKRELWSSGDQSIRASFLRSVPSDLSIDHPSGAQRRACWMPRLHGLCLSFCFSEVVFPRLPWLALVLVAQVGIAPGLGDRFLRLLLWCANHFAVVGGCLLCMRHVEPYGWSSAQAVSLDISLAPPQWNICHDRPYFYLICV